jgi:MFS family permease
LEVLLIILAIFFGDGLISMMEVSLPLYMNEVLHFEPLIIGFVYGICTVTYTISLFILGRFQKKLGGRWFMLSLGVAIMGIGYVA